MFPDVAAELCEGTAYLAHNPLFGSGYGFSVVGLLGISLPRSRRQPKGARVGFVSGGGWRRNIW